MHLGITQNQDVVDHVDLPPWAAGNPYLFTTQLRQMLESEQTSAGLNEWIDLIFGFKQRGDEAKDNFNVYYYLTYEEYSNCLQDESDEVYRKSCEAQVVHFGQIPPQLFDKPHPQRVTRPTKPFEFVIKERVTLMNQLK